MKITFDKLDLVRFHQFMNTEERRSADDRVLNCVTDADLENFIIEQQRLMILNETL